MEKNAYTGSIRPARVTALKRPLTVVIEKSAHVGARRYYGGDQSWFERPTQVGGGCAQVTTANLLCYLARKKGLEALCKGAGDEMGKESYLRFLNEVYAALPSLELPVLSAAYDRGERVKLFTLGMSNPFYLARRAKKLAAKKGVRLKARLLLPPVSKERLTAFLREGLLLDAPVALLNLFAPAVMERETQGGRAVAYKKHWVTVASMAEHENGKTVLDVSSWGERYALELEQFFQKGRMSVSLAAVYLFP